MSETNENNLPELVALVGLDGTGKGHLATHLSVSHGYLKLGASDVIRQAINERPHLMGLPMDEATLRLKEELGGTFISDYALSLYNAGGDQYGGLVLDGIRRLPEIVNFKKLGGKVLLINANPENRFEQLAARGRADAPKTIEDMHTRDIVQLHGDGTGTNNLNLQAIIDLADGSVQNNFDDRFHQEAVETLRKMSNMPHDKLDRPIS